MEYTSVIIINTSLFNIPPFQCPLLSKSSPLIPFLLNIFSFQISISLSLYIFFSQFLFFSMSFSFYVLCSQYLSFQCFPLSMFPHLKTQYLPSQYLHFFLNILLTQIYLLSMSSFLNVSFSQCFFLSMSFLLNISPFQCPLNVFSMSYHLNILSSYVLYSQDPLHSIFSSLLTMFFHFNTYITLSMWYPLNFSISFPLNVHSSPLSMSSLLNTFSS